MFATLLSPNHWGFVFLETTFYDCISLNLLTRLAGVLDDRTALSELCDKVKLEHNAQQTFFDVVRHQS